MFKDKKGNELNIGDFVKYGNSGKYEIADLVYGPAHHKMVAIYDEPDDDPYHVDYLNLKSVEKI